MKIGKNILLYSQYIRRIRHTGKYVPLKKLCDYCGLDSRNFTSAVKERLGNIVWHICSQGMMITPAHSVWYVANKESADFAMQNNALVLLSDIQYDDYPCIISEEPIALYAKMCQYYRSLQKNVSATVVTVLQFENRVSDNGTVAL